MKKLILPTVIFLFLLFVSNEIQGQTTQTKLDQLKLMEQFIGTWQWDIGKDTAAVWEFQQHNKAFVSTIYRVIKGEESFWFEQDCGFSSQDNKFKGFNLYPSGNFLTWIGSFTGEKKWEGEFVRNFNPDAITGKFEAVFESPTSIIITNYDANGVKASENKFVKVK